MSIAMSAPIIPSLLCISSSTMQLSGTHEITPFTLHIIPGSLILIKTLPQNIKTWLLWSIILNGKVQNFCPPPLGVVQKFLPSPIRVVQHLLLPPQR